MDRNLLEWRSHEGERVPNRDIVVVGASAGGMDPLRRLSEGLADDLPASVLIVQHMGATAPSLLAEILARGTSLITSFARDGEGIERGRIYVAPPDRHLMVEPGVLRLQPGARQNRHRPAVDPLFRSAAQAYGRRVIGVILSGSLDDGAAGLRAIKEAGGIALVQDPKEAAFPGMPESALASVRVDHCVPVRELVKLVNELTRETLAEEPAPSTPEEGFNLTPSALRATNFGCPSCGGVLWESQESFRCHVGHIFGAESLLAEQEFRLEDSLWVAIRTLEESAALKRRMADRFRERDFGTKLVERAEDAAALADFHAQRLREVLVQVHPRGEE
jgi:two-component system, chemotaxis family, protein-glutamate methylesterase/glutaminase